MPSTVSIVVSTDPPSSSQGAFTDVRADVFVEGTTKAIGNITGILINRQQIPNYSFYETFDEHSGDMEWVAGSLLENQYGRPTLQSILDAGDDPEFDFLLIQSFWIREDQSSDVASHALRKFLYSPQIRGDSGFWSTSSAAYVLRPVTDSAADETSTTGKRKHNDNNVQQSYHESVPFLRNGFFQDAALVGKDADNARILVGGVAHFEKPMKSHAEVLKSVQLLSSRPDQPRGKDLEILHCIQRFVTTLFKGSSQRAMVSLPALLQLLQDEDRTSQGQLKSLQKDLSSLVLSGGSIARSTALHMACERNAIKVAKLLVKMDPTSFKIKDDKCRTPLMLAAKSASMRCSIDGIDETQVIDALLAAGASKTDVDSSGMTAYGYFRKMSQTMVFCTRYEHRSKLTDVDDKLFPPNGPTLTDLTGGKGGATGFVDYGEEDAEEEDFEESGDY